MKIQTTSPRNWGLSLLNRRDPWGDMQSSMNHMMERFQNMWPESWDKEWARDMPSFTPSINVKDTGSEIRVSAELPGMTDKDIEIFLDRDFLTIQGEKKLEKEEKSDNRYYMECKYGNFRRTIPLPYEVDRERVAAKFTNGVLNIDLKKSDAAKNDTRKINIQS